MRTQRTRPVRRGTIPNREPLSPPLGSLPGLSFWMVLIAYSIVIANLAVVAFGTDQLGTTIPNLTRDPNAISGYPVHTGFLSNVGVMFWAGTAAICIFSFVVLRGQGIRGDATWYLLVGGLITTVLLIDDLFMMHEAVYPRHFGTTDRDAYLAYGLMVVGYLFWFRRTVLRTNFLFLVLAFAGFAISVMLDITEWVDLSTDDLFLAEDGSKFFGIASWGVYFATVCAREVSQLQTPSPSIAGLQR